MAVKKPIMARQLQVYDLVSDIIGGSIYNADELSKELGISIRMLQRDLKDLRDSGLIKLKFDRRENRYVPDGEAIFDESSTPKRKKHLKKLYRLGILIRCLSKTDVKVLESYEYSLWEYNEYCEEVKDDPENNTPEELANMYKFYVTEKPEFFDLKAEYYELFPDSNERTRQRDFEEMNKAGFTIYYSRKYKTFIFEDDSNVE